MIIHFLKRCCNKAKFEMHKLQNKAKIIKSFSYLKSLRMMYNGKRCFIIGNGPSLKVEDLEKLKNEVCLSSHRIYYIFSKTDWRPTYYCAQDEALINASADDINHFVVDSKKIIGVVTGHKYKKINDAFYVPLIFEEFYPNLPKFSENVLNGVYEGFTVSYMCIQLAVYMGFKEIYLLGVDHNYSVTYTDDGKIEKHTGLQDYFSKEYMLDVVPQIHKSTLAYQAARKYADEHGIKIYNATRGGKLEAFDRVDFDTLF